MHYDRERRPTNGREGKAASKLLLLALALLLVGLAGYAGYYLYPRFDLPHTVGIGLLALAAGAGVASFFSPCSFPLLLTLLSRQAGAGAPPGRRLRRALLFAASMSLGAASFVLGVGLLIALGGQQVAAGVTFTSTAGIALRIGVGALLVVLSLGLLGLLPMPFVAVARLARPLSRRGLIERHPVPGFAAFGFGYLMAGFGWTGPILAGLAGQALVSGGFAAALSAFIAAALVIVLLLFAAALTTALAQESVIGRVRASGPVVKRMAGVVLAAVGVWFILLGAFAGAFARVFPV